MYIYLNVCVYSWINSSKLLGAAAVVRVYRVYNHARPRMLMRMHKQNTGARWRRRALSWRSGCSCSRYRYMCVCVLECVCV
jgi:hypothetical protein